MNSGITAMLKTICPLLLMLAYFPVAAYSGFSSIVSVWTGVRHFNHTDCWVPIMAGLVLLAAVSWISLFVTRRVFSRL